MNRLKNLPDCMSPLSWVFIVIAVVTPLVVVFRPTLKELIVFMVVDHIAYLVNRKIEGRLFLWKYPDTRLYFQGLGDAGAHLSFSEKQALFESFMKYPRRRATWCYFGSFLKCIPAALVAIFYWDHAVSNTTQALLFATMEAINLCYFYGSVFIESHIYLSNLLSDLHEKYDWSDVFKKTSIRYSKLDFELQETLTIFFIIVFMLGLQSLVVVSHQYTNTTQLAAKLFIIGGAATLLFLRIWFLGRSFFVGGLEKLFKEMNVLDYRSFRNVLPMHTSPLLAQFEKTYNLLNDRLRTSEQELFSLVSQEAEKGRYRALGEFSALVAHDLSGPLHAANFCASELMGAPQPEKVKPYLERISKNLSRALELTGSIRARLKNPSHEGGAGTFGEAHKHVVNLLSVQYHTENFQKVQFQVDPQVDRLHLRISSVDLTHVLDNLYRNAVENLLRNAISAPSIKVTLANLSLEEAEITVEDNGSGLSQQDFERITSYQFKREPSSLSNQGLGLRLTRRLIEFNQGHLEVRPQASDVGTFFSLRLPLAVAIQTETKHTFEETPSLKTTPA